MAGTAASLERTGARAAALRTRLFGIQIFKEACEERRIGLENPNAMSTPPKPSPLEPSYASH